MDIPVGKPKPFVQDQVGQRRMLMLHPAANKKFNRRECRPSRHINDCDFVIHRREPRVAGHQNRAQQQERDNDPSVTSEAPRDGRLGGSYLSVMWLRNQVDADATGEKVLGQVRELLLDSGPRARPRNPARCWYHLCGTICNRSSNKKGSSQRIFVNSKRIQSRRKSPGSSVRSSVLGLGRSACLGMILLLCSFSAAAQSPQSPLVAAASSPAPEAPAR